MRTLLSLLGLSALALANGTLNARGPVRLTDHRVHARLHDRVCEVVVEQTFRSDADVRLEGRYVFPLPDEATVSEFAMTMGGKMVKGEVMEKNKARRIYEGIVARKKDPGLLEKIDRGVFSARVFPIEPKSDLTIRIVYQQILTERNGTTELRYPLARTRLGANDVKQTSIVVDVATDAPLRSIYSPSHAIDTAETKENGKQLTRISWEGGRNAQTKDFLLYVTRSADAVAFSLLSHRVAGEPGTFVALLAPVAAPKEDEILPKDVVYVLDTSGSMKGKKLAQAQAALQSGIRKLRVGDRFNLVGFSTEARSFRDELVQANPKNMAAAIAWVQAQQAAGGTAMDEAIQTALKMHDDERLGIVVLLTDGLPSVGERNPQTIVSNVERNRRNARVFVFGIGFDQNVAFLDSVAKTTRGAREYITPEQDLTVVVGRFFDRIDQPVLTDLRLELGEGVSEVYPKQLPDLFAGDQLVVMGRYSKAGPKNIRLHGKLRGKAVTYHYEGSLSNEAEVAPLPRLWAERKVEYLVQQLQLHGRNKELVDEVVRLGTKHSIVTAYTSGLVVEDEEIGVAGGGDIGDRPFTGPSSNSAIGIGGGASGFMPRRRGGRRNLRSGGGSARTQDAVELGLFWLASQQDVTTGLWTDPTTTASALLAYLGAGYTDRGSAKENKHAKTVRHGLRALMVAQRANGSYGPTLAADARATLALCEAFSRTKNPRYKKPAQSAVRWLNHSQPNDLITMGHVALALKVAKSVGLEVDPDAFERVRASMLNNKAKSNEERAAIVLTRILLGEDPRTSKAIHALSFGTPTVASTNDHLYFGTLAAFQIGGKTFRAWNEAMKPLLVESQQSEDKPRRGSWGDIHVTATRTRCLEIYYLYRRLFGPSRR